LPLAERVKRKATLLFDAHEFAPAEWEEFAKWRLLIRPYVLWCLKALKSVDLMTTICAGIQGEYKKSYGIDSEVITNACRYFDLAPKPVQEPIRMIYTGIAHPGRHIDQAVQILKMLDLRFHLDMILVPGMEKVIAEIKELAKDEPRIRFLEPVPLEEIVPFCNRYDIGFFPLIPTNRNVHHGLGNKFFEFIQARLCLALSPLQEMARLTKQYDCGVVAQDFSDEAFASMLNALSSSEIRRKKENASQAALALSLDANWAALDRFLESCDVAAQIASK
ncbi:MAG: hypothetical protein KDK48_04860, partial [Chlamydiia bacterium]|nr:hypothetical protein [Chlamydiia bacterium]